MNEMRVGKSQMSGANVIEPGKQSARVSKADYPELGKTEFKKMASSKSDYPELGKEAHKQAKVGKSDSDLHQEKSKSMRSSKADYPGLSQPDNHKSAAVSKGAMSGVSGNSGSIILEPRQMFQTLQTMEKATQNFCRLIQDVAAVLEAASILTFAIGFTELIKAAESSINQVGSAVVAANNAFNTACKEVVNQLVSKFAAEGAKSDYSEPPFPEISIKTNHADRAQVYPPAILALIGDLMQKNSQVVNKANEMREVYRQTVNIWQGSAADKTRNSFERLVVPRFEEMHQSLAKIVEAGLNWVEDAVRFEAALGV